jgi:Phosphotransferase enzyme family
MKIITIDNAAEYLLQRQLLNIEQIIDGDVHIIDASRRNRNIQCITRRGANYLLKQPNILDYDNSKTTTINIEANLFSLVSKEDNLAPVSNIIPRFVDLDSERNILIIEFLKDSQSLYEYIYRLPIRTTTYELPTEPFSNLGKMMAVYHSVFKRYIDSPSVISFLPKSLPSNDVITHPEPALLSEMSPANLQLLKLIQNYEELSDFLEDLYMHWDLDQTLIHGDMRMDNVILVPKDHVSGGSDGNNNNNISNSLAQLKIVDWELARVGDPAWDIAGILNDFMILWLYSLPVAYTTPNQNVQLGTDQLVRLSQRPINNMKRSIRAFWKEYIKNNTTNNNIVKFDAKKSNDELLKRATKYCAALLIQRIYESEKRSDFLSSVAFYVVQTSLNMICNRDDAIMYLFGIPTSSWW